MFYYQRGLRISFFYPKNLPCCSFLKGKNIYVGKITLLRFYWKQKRVVEATPVVPPPIYPSSNGKLGLKRVAGQQQ